MTPEKMEKIKELVRLKDELVLVNYWKVIAPWLNHEREREILKKMKEIVSQII